MHEVRRNAVHGRITAIQTIQHDYVNVLRDLVADGIHSGTFVAATTSDNGVQQQQQAESSSQPTDARSAQSTTFCDVSVVSVPCGMHSSRVCADTASAMLSCMSLTNQHCHVRCITVVIGIWNCAILNCMLLLRTSVPGVLS